MGGPLLNPLAGKKFTPSPRLALASPSVRPSLSPFILKTKGVAQPKIGTNVPHGRSNQCVDF